MLVAENGKVVYEKSFGYADVEAKKLNTKDTEFQLASIAKTFTAIAVLQLKEKGKLGLDDKLSNILPISHIRKLPCVICSRILRGCRI